MKIKKILILLSFLTATLTSCKGCNEEKPEEKTLEERVIPKYERDRTNWCDINKNHPKCKRQNQK